VCEEIAKGKTAKQAFQVAFGKTLEEFYQEFSDYVKIFQ
jgi:hypothetical protein